MNLKSCTEAGVCRRKLEIQIDAEQFKKAVDAAARKGVAKLTVPGFRKGKAPRAMIEKIYGKEFFYEDAVNDIYPEALEKAIEESGLDVIEDKIDLDVTEIGEDGMTFTAVVTIAPVVSIEGYKGIKLTRSVDEITDEAVDAEIEKTRNRNSRTIAVEDRPAQDGDIAEFDFEGFVDGVPFEGGKAEHYSLVLGSGNFIPGFEEQMIGHCAGEEFDVNVTFPEEYHAEELAGKPAVFKIKLHELKEKQLPELDDEFVKDVSEFETVEEYRASVRAELEKTAQDNAEHKLENDLSEAVIELVEGDIPDVMIEKRIDQQMNEFDYRLRSQGLSLDTYIQYLGTDVQAMRDQMRDQAESHVRLRLGLEKIVELEGIEVTDEELDAEYAKIAEAYKMELDAVKAAISAEDLKLDIAVEKAMKLVRENAEISENE